jgi:NAD(P)H-dependent FMN reductase
VVGIPGSLNANSANSALVSAIASSVTGDLQVWSELGTLPHFSPDVDGGAAVASLRRAVGESDAVLIATPEYAGGMPGSLKNALDWLVGTGELYDKPVVVISVAPSAERGGNARRWVEDVVRMQGSRIAASFTVAVSPTEVAGDLEPVARAVWARVVAALDDESRPAPFTHTGRRSRN